MSAPPHHGATIVLMTVFAMVAVMLAFAIMGALVVIRQSVRRARGCCVHCGYDLRGTTEARCSECGNKIMR